ncbi:MAG: winged helix-turn-helix domain-containing protein [Candidatus Kryptoniota bacterium]
MTDFDYQLIDDVLHSRIRLMIVAALIGVEEADFTFLRDTVKTTDGNLSIHLKKLEDAGYVSSKKRFVNRKPLSTYKVTEKGRRALEHYVEMLEKLLKK